MAFDLEKFKEEGLRHGGQRACLFDVTVNDNDKSSFMISTVRYDGTVGITDLTMIEDEDMRSKAFLDSVAKLPEFTMKLRLFSKTGETVFEDERRYGSLSYAIALSWEEHKHIAAWKVETYELRGTL
jgi:hypothetical protein